MRMGGRFGLMVVSGIFLPASALAVYYLALWHFVAKYITIDRSNEGLQNCLLLFCAGVMVSSILIQVRHI